MAPIEIRPVTPDEEQRAGEVTMQAYEEFVPKPDRPGWHTYLERIGDVAGRAGRMPVLVAIVDGEVAGTATIELDDHVEADWTSKVQPDEAHLRMIGVHPKFRRRGIGRALVEASVELARSRDRTRITLETTEVMVAAQRMYESMGFSFLGRRVVEPGLTFLNYELRLTPAAS